MRGQKKSTLVERHAPDAIATAVTETCARVDARSSARGRPSIPESETAVDAGDCVMRASPGWGAGPASISSSRLASCDDGHSHGTAREWRRVLEGESTGGAVGLCGCGWELGHGAHGEWRLLAALLLLLAVATFVGVTCHGSFLFLYLSS